MFWNNFLYFGQKVFYGGLNAVIHKITDILPASPFTRFLDIATNVPVLYILNYFVPISAYASITLLWAQIMALIYSKRVILRWVKILK